jgi:hypothetical protein
VCVCDILRPDTALPVSLCVRVCVCGMRNAPSEILQTTTFMSAQVHLAVLFVAPSDMEVNLQKVSCCCWCADSSKLLLLAGIARCDNVSVA